MGKVSNLVKHFLLLYIYKPQSSHNQLSIFVKEQRVSLWHSIYLLPSYGHFTVETNKIDFTILLTNHLPSNNLLLQ